MSVKVTWQTASRLAIAAILLLASLGVALPSASTAQGALPWRAEYFDNVSLSGAPVRVRDEAAIDHDWRNNAPDDGIPHDGFGARWTANWYFGGGTYSFKANVDDGVRVWLDGQLVIDQWRNQAVTLYQVIVPVSTGNHALRVEYYDNIGNAVAMVWWDLLTPSTNGILWRSEYFNNPWLIGPPVLVRDETAIDHAWGSGAPAAGLPGDNFSVRWTGTAGFDQTGTYTFTVTVDDGVRAWIDGGLLVDQWRAQTTTTTSIPRFLTAGSHPIVVEYYEASGDATIKFSWQETGQPTPQPTQTTPSPSGEIIVDNKDSGFQKSGPAESWYERSVGYKDHIYWTYNSTSQLYNYAKWTPQLPGAGNYEVLVYIPRDRADTKSARYAIHHNGVDNSASVNQSIYFDKWVSIGTYYFAASGNEYVYLNDVTGEPYASRKIGFDAVKFVPKNGAVPTATTVAPTAVPTAISPTATSPTAPTAVPPTPTPTATTPPTPTLPTCAISPILGFGRIWSTYPEVRSRLGCPVEVEQSSWSAEQTFVNGFMFWRGDRSLVYALYSDGKWQSFVDTWAAPQDEWDVSIVPPAGFFQPKRGFGQVWREQFVQPGVTVRDKLSWASTEERGLNASWQGYTGGLMLWSDVHGFFVLYYDNNTWSQYR
jgi:hypothetical protein